METENIEAIGMNRIISVAILSVSQALAYTIYDTGKSFDTGDKEGYISTNPSMMEKNHIVEFWHTLNRSTPFRQKIIPNTLLDNAIAYTLAWLAFYRAGGHRLPLELETPVPEWGKEYSVSVIQAYISRERKR